MRQQIWLQLLALHRFSARLAASLMQFDPRWPQATSKKNWIRDSLNAAGGHPDKNFIWQAANRQRNGGRLAANRTLNLHTLAATIMHSHQCFVDMLRNNYSNTKNDKTTQHMHALDKTCEQTLSMVCLRLVKIV